MWSRREIKVIFLIVFITLSPSLITLAYSQTLIHIGIGPIKWWWAGMTSPPSLPISISVNNSVPFSTVTLHGEQLNLYITNITGGNVSIQVSCETNETILTLNQITDYNARFVYPTETPSGNNDQDFNITVIWEGENATVTIDYFFIMALHIDGNVIWTLPEYELVYTSGISLLVGGLVVLIFSIIYIRRRSLLSNFHTFSE